VTVMPHTAGAIALNNAFGSGPISRYLARDPVVIEISAPSLQLSAPKNVPVPPITSEPQAPTSLFLTAPRIFRVMPLMEFAAYIGLTG
jgi:hypothetical protein